MDVYLYVYPEFTYIFISYIFGIEELSTCIGENNIVISIVVFRLSLWCEYRVYK
jgi:hypothetical protein